MKYLNFVRWTFFSFNIFIKKGKSNVCVYKNRNISVATEGGTCFVRFLPRCDRCFFFCMYKYLCVHAHICILIYSYIYIYIHTRTYIYIYTSCVCILVKNLADKILLKRPNSGRCTFEGY